MKVEEVGPVNGEVIDDVGGAFRTAFTERCMVFYTQQNETGSVRLPPGLRYSPSPLERGLLASLVQGGELSELARLWPVLSPVRRPSAAPG